MRLPWIKEKRSSASDFLNASDLETTRVKVTPNTALVLSAVQGCVKVLSEDLASLPLFIYKSTKEGKEKAKDHPLYNVLHLLPNEYMDSFTFFQTAMTHLLLWGNAYVEIIYSKGQPQSLFLIHPAMVEKLKLNGKTWYKVKLDNGDRFIRDMYIMHLMAMTTDGFNGISPVEKACDVFDLTNYSQKFGLKFFENGANAGGVLEHPGVLDDPAYDRLKTSMNERNAGINNSHRLMILEQGMKYNKIGIPPNEAQMLETRKFQIEDIARIFRVPLHLIQSLDHATNNNIEHQSIDFVTHTLRPWLVRWERMFKIKLFYDTDYFAEFQIDGLLRGDYKTRMEGYAIGRNSGFLSANEVRSLENMNAIPDGDVYLQPLNMQPVGTVPEQKSTIIEEKRDITAENIEIRRSNAKKRSKITLSYQNLMKKAFEEIAKREKADIMRKLEQIKDKPAEDVISYLEKFYSTHDEFMRKKVYPVAENLSKIIDTLASEEIKIDSNQEESDKIARDFTDSFIEKYIIRHRSQLIGLINETREESDPEYIQDITERIDEWVEKQPEKSSLETIIQLAGFMASFRFLSNGNKLVWVNTGSDTCPFCKELDGKVVGRDQPFVTDGSSVKDMKINGAKFHPPLHEGCVCQISPG